MLGLAWSQLSGWPSPSQLTVPGFIFKWEDWPRGSFKRWDFNPQFYSDSLSIGLTFPSNSPFLREYTVTLHFANTLSEHNARRCECARDINTRQSLHFVMSSESLMKSHHRKSWQLENEGRAQPLGQLHMPAGPPDLGWGPPRGAGAPKTSEPVLAPRVLVSQVPSNLGRGCCAKPMG